MAFDNNNLQIEDSGLFNTMVNIFVSPMEAFASIEKQPAILFPLVLILLGNIATYVWYFSVVDYPWLVDQLIERMEEMPADQITVVRDAYASMGNTGMMLSSIVSIVVLLVLVYSLQAGYLSMVCALVGTPYRFSQWFSLNCWVYLPGLLIVLVSMTNILLSENGQLGMYDLNSLSLNNLGFGGGKNVAINTLLDSLSLATFWSLGLLVAAYNTWVKSGYLTATLVVLTPHGLIYGIWAMVALS